MNRRALLPLTPVYRLALALREVRLGTQLEPVRQLRFPVVSIGSLSAGGSGKTPLTIALARALAARGIQVDVLSRGYGRHTKTAMRVDPDGAAADFGDEPLLIAREAGVPVYVAAQRYEAGLLAEQNPDESRLVTGHDFSRAGEPHKSTAASASAGTPVAIHLLDDGYQHRQLHRDVNILLLDAQDLRDHLLPAGNLREPLSAMRRAHIVAIPAEDPELEAHLGTAVKLQTADWNPAIWRLRRRMDVPPIDGPILAFCGIARPGQFFAGLESAGLHLASRIAFRDHHHYVQHDLDCILDAARSIRASAILTTEKDRARLGSLAASLPLQTVRLRIEIESESEAIEEVVNRITATDH